MLRTWDVIARIITTDEPSKNLAGANWLPKIVAAQKRCVKIIMSQRF